MPVRNYVTFAELAKHLRLSQGKLLAELYPKYASKDRYPTELAIGSSPQLAKKKDSWNVNAVRERLEKDRKRKHHRPPMAAPAKHPLYEVCEYGCGFVRIVVANDGNGVTLGKAKKDAKARLAEIERVIKDSREAIEGVGE